jgi:hypothetical protein
VRKSLLSVESWVGLTLFCAVMVAVQPFAASQETRQQWSPNDRNRTEPSIITSGTASTQSKAGAPPSDAVVLFNGKDLSNWQAANGGGPANWTVGNGYFAVAPGTGDIQTKQSYGDCQLHLEWATPNPPKGVGRDRGNSGVFLQGLYEVQVLDSYQNVTYADGEAAAVYGQYPPLVNATRPPGQWQTYDVVLHGARFDQGGKLLRPANVSVIFNGVLVQDHVNIMGPNVLRLGAPYEPTAEKLPLRLQDHHHPVRYRNLWIRELHGDGQ